MKNLVLILTFLATTVTFSQNSSNLSDKKNPNSNESSFTYNSNGLSPSQVIVKIKGLKKNDLYTKTMEWFNEKYNDPKNAIKRNDKNEMIRFNGYANNAICFGIDADYVCERLKYAIELTFEDEQYIIKPLSLSYSISQKNKEKERTINFNNSTFHNKNGDIDIDYEKVPSQIETLFNNINTSLMIYINGKDQVDEY